MRLQSWVVLILASALAFPVAAAEGRVFKVLPQFLDKQGRESLSPSLYDRDAYQAILRRDPTKRSTLRFAVDWKANTPESEGLKIRVEMRGVAQANPLPPTTVEMEVHQKHWFSHWAYIVVPAEQYHQIGEVTAWRVTLWDGDKLLGEQKSFLW